MTAADSGYDRRSVLKTTGLALAGSVGAAGTASAGHLQPADCAYAVESATLYLEGCPFADPVGTLEVGEKVQVLDRCDEDTVQVAGPENFIGEWTRESALEKTTC